MVYRVDASEIRNRKNYFDLEREALNEARAAKALEQDYAIKQMNADLLQKKFDLEQREFEEKKRKSEMMRQIIGGGASDLNNPMGQLGALAQVDERFIPDYLRAKIEYDAPEKVQERARQQRLNQMISGDTAMTPIGVQAPPTPGAYSGIAAGQPMQPMPGAIETRDEIQRIQQGLAAPTPTAPQSIPSQAADQFPQPDVWLRENMPLVELLGPDKALTDVYLPQQKSFMEQRAKISEENRKTDVEGLAALRKQSSSVPALDAKAKTVISTIGGARDMVSDATSGIGSLFSFVPGSAARNLQAKLDTIKANLGFEELQEMRLNSPTGGALGQVTEKELNFLQSTIASLDQAQSPEQLVAALNTVENYMRGRRERIINAYNADLERYGASQMSGLKPYFSELTEGVGSGFSIAPSETSDGWGIVQ